MSRQKETYQFKRFDKVILSDLSFHDPNTLPKVSHYSSLKLNDIGIFQDYDGYDYAIVYFEKTNRNHTLYTWRISLASTPKGNKIIKKASTLAKGEIK